MGALVTILEMQDKLATLEKRLADAEERLEAWRVLGKQLNYDGKTSLAIYHIAYFAKAYWILKNLGEI